MTKNKEEKWELRRGWADWGMPCQHDIVQGEDQIAGIPSITPYCMGASAADKEYAARQWSNAKLFFAAPDLLKVCKELEESSEYWSEYDVPLGIVDRLKNAIAKAEGKE